MKPTCVIGILDTPRGVEIGEELMEWFREDYVLIPVMHNGVRFEYPAIKTALEESVKLGEPVLYIHTKGAGNLNPALTPQDEEKYMGVQCQPPHGATILDWQETVRKMWRSEFIDHKDWYLNTCNTNEPVVAAPYVSPQKHTWTNGFMFNPVAAKLVYPLKFNPNRWSYEKLWNGTKCRCVARVLDNMLGYPAMYKWKADVWKHFND